MTTKGSNGCNLHQELKNTSGKTMTNDFHIIAKKTPQMRHWELSQHNGLCIIVPVIIYNLFFLHTVLMLRDFCWPTAPYAKCKMRNGPEQQRLEQGTGQSHSRG